MTYKVTTPRRVLDDDAKVSNLIHLDIKRWDVWKVRDIFFPHEAEVILKILLSAHMPNDILVWAKN